MFDAKQYLESLSPPQYKDSRGRIHTGKIISYEEFMPFQERMRELAAGEPSLTKSRTIIREFVGLLFPHPAWCFWRLSVTSHVLKLPPPAALEALEDFSASLAKMYTAQVEGE